MIANLRITGNFTADKRWHTGFATVHCVITSNRFDGQGIMCLGIKRESVVLNSNSFVTRRIVAGYLDLNVISPFFKQIARNRDFVTQMAVIVDHHAVEITPTYRYGNRVTFFGISTDDTRHHRWHTGFVHVDDVITRNGFNRD